MLTQPFSRLKHHLWFQQLVYLAANILNSVNFIGLLSNALDEMVVFVKT